MKNIEELGKQLVEYFETPIDFIELLLEKTQLDINTLAIEVLCLRYFCIDFSLHTIKIDNDVKEKMRESFNTAFMENTLQVSPDFEIEILNTRLQQYMVAISQATTQPPDVEEPTPVRRKW